MRQSNELLHGQTVLITGASAGIGAACAEVFAEAGADLVLWGRRSERLEAIGVRLRKECNVHVECAVVDVRDREKVLSCAPEYVDILINNAGLSRNLVPLQEGIFEDWDEMIDTNLKGLLNVTRAVLPKMIERGSGHVFNIASIAGSQPYRSGNVYGATKAAVKMLSDSLQIDLNGTGVRVSNIDPGLVETEFSEVRFRGNTQRAAQTYTGLTPLTGRDVAEVVLFVATRPQHVSIQDVLITPTDQATVSVVNRKT